MSKKHVVLATMDQRLFVKELLRLGKLGATLDESFPVYKSGFMRATLQVDASVDVGENAVLKVFTMKENENSPKAAPKESKEPTEVKEESPKAKAKSTRKASAKSSQEDKAE